MGRRTALLAVVAAVIAALTACGDGKSAHQSTSTTPPPGTVTGTVWVADSDGDSLTVIDAAANAVVTTVTGLRHPHNVQVSLDGNVVYVVDARDRLLAVDPFHYLVSVVARTGRDPAHVIAAPNGSIYATDSGDGTVSVYQPGALQLTGTIQVGGVPHGLRAAADGSVIAVANTGAGAVDLIDPADNQVVAAVPVGPDPIQVAVSADGRYAYTGISDPPSVVKVDVAGHNVVSTVAVAVAPVQLYLSSDGGTLLAAEGGTRDNPGHELAVIDPASMSLRQTIPTGSGPHGVVIDDSGTRAWVTNTFDNTVSVIDLQRRSVVATIKVGAGPAGVSYAKLAPASAHGTTIQVYIPAPAPRP